MNPASVERKEVIGLHRITQKRLRELCKKDKLYQTPELNDVLYLHYQGFQYIECLEEYTELKCLWLECNAISEIEGLQNQTKLKCLFLQNNLIKRIENLESCRQLDTLNLASNHIRKIENCGVDILPVLNTLNLSTNYLRDSESLRALEECKSLSVLDLSNNRIDDILVVKVFAKMPSLRVLVLQGNPVVSMLPQYRKTLILECKELTYLDSRPVFPKDRACAEAWKRGGYVEERKEQGRWNRKERKKIRDSVNATIRMRNKHLPKEKQMELVTSSDSESEDKRRKERREDQTESRDPRILIETGDNEDIINDMWDEVGDSSFEPSPPENLKENKEDGSSNLVNDHTVEINAQSSESNEKLDTVESVNMTTSILKMVDNPTDVESEIPPLITGAVEESNQRKRPLIEEISTDVNTEVSEDTIENPVKKIKSLGASESSSSKKLSIEEVNSNEKVSEEQCEVVKEQESNEFLELDSKTTMMTKLLETPHVTEIIKIENRLLKDERSPGETLMANTLIEEIDQKQEFSVSECQGKPTLMSSYKETVNLKEIEMNFSEKEGNCNWKKLLMDEIDAEEIERSQGKKSFLEFDNKALIIKTSNPEEETKETVEARTKKSPLPSIEEIFVDNPNQMHPPRNAEFSDDSSTITSISFESDSVEEEQSENELYDIEERRKHDVTKLCDHNIPQLDIQEESKVSILSAVKSESESDDEGTMEEFTASANAICDVVMNNLESHEQETLEKPISTVTDNGDDKIENYEPDLEIQKILDLLPDDETEIRVRRSQISHEPEEFTSLTPEEMEHEQKCEEINSQVVKDLEELTHNMDAYIAECQQQQLQQSFSSNDSIYNRFGTSISDNQLSQSSIFGKRIGTEEVIFEQRKANEDEQMKVIFKGSDQEMQTTSQNEMAFKDSEYTKRSHSKEDFRLKLNISPLDSGYTNYEPKESLQQNFVSPPEKAQRSPEHFAEETNLNSSTEMINVGKSMETLPKDKIFEAGDMRDELQTKISQLPINENDPDMEQTISEDVKVDYRLEVAPDLKRGLEPEFKELYHNIKNYNNYEGDHGGVVSSNEDPLMGLTRVLESRSMKEYEKETTDLRELLQKLEQQNEKLGLVQQACKDLLDSKSDEEYYDAEDNTDVWENISYMVNDVIKEVVTEVIDKAEQDTQKSRNYQISDMESDDDSYSVPPESTEDAVKPIRGVLSAFNSLIREMGRKNREEQQRQMELYHPRRVPSTEAEKIESLNTLIETPSLLEHHKDAYECLSEQVKAVRNRQHEDLKQLVDRVYSQKEKYNDSLELMDGRLVVIKKDTGEIEELPIKKSVYGTDSTDEEDNDYETASSENEIEDESSSTACCLKKVDKKPTWDFGMGAFLSHTCTPRYKPTMRKSAEQLVLNALKENEKAAEESTEEEDDNENGDEGDCRVKQVSSVSSIYSNIDEEFFKKLDFEKVVEESSKDENFVECARSYEELRKILKPHCKEANKSELSFEEEDIIKKLKIDPAKSEIIQEEDCLMQNLLQRTKEANEHVEDLSGTELNNGTSNDEGVERDLDGKRTDIYKYESNVEKYQDSSNNCLIYELKPGRKKANMLKELRDNDVEDSSLVLSGENNFDYGDFTEPLEENFEQLTIEEETNFEAVRSSYEIQLSKWKQAIQEKKSMVENTDVGIQCDSTDTCLRKESQSPLTEIESCFGEPTQQPKMVSTSSGTTTNLDEQFIDISTAGNK